MLTLIDDPTTYLVHSYLHRIFSTVKGCITYGVFITIFNRKIRKLTRYLLPYNNSMFPFLQNILLFMGIDYK